MGRRCNIKIPLAHTRCIIVAEEIVGQAVTCGERRFVVFCILLFIIFDLTFLSKSIIHFDIIIQTHIHHYPVEAELVYVVGILEYIVARISSKEVISLSRRRRNGYLDEQGVISTGCFLNLTCGHNNQYSSEERGKLIALIHRSCGENESII